jgi:peptidyl-prolyl cis-trans isomerase D
MLEQMRKLTGNTVILVMFGTIIFVFIFFFGPQTGGYGPQARVWAGKGSGAVIYNTQMLAGFERRGRWNGVPQPASAVETADIQRVLVEDRLFVLWLAERAEQAGLRVTQDEVRCYIANWDPRFMFDGEAICADYPAGQAERLRNWEFEFYSDGQGRISENYRVGILSMFAMSTDEYEAWKGRELLARRYLQLLRESMAIPLEAVRATWERRKDTVDLEFVRLDPSLATATTVSDEDVAAFEAAEGAAIDAYYEENAESFDIEAQVRIRRIYITRPTAEGAETDAQRALYESALARAEAGEDFEALARELSENTFEAEQGGDMGLRTVDNLASTLVEATADMEVGAVKGVESSGNWSVIRLEERIEASRRPLDEVRSEIARTILQQRASDSAESRMLDRGRAIITLAQAGSTLEEAATAEAAAAAPAVPAVEGSGEPVAAEGSADVAPAQAAPAVAALTVQTTGPFGREQEPVDLRAYGIDVPAGFTSPAPPPDSIPGIGTSRELATLAFELSADAPVHPEPIEVEGTWFVVRLVERSTLPAEPPSSELSSIAESMRTGLADALFDAATTDNRLFKGLAFGDLPPAIVELYDLARQAGALRVNEELFTVDVVDDLAATASN